MPGRVTNFANIVSLLGALVATSVVLGLLGAGLVMPAVGATGAAARQGVHVFESLPGEFTQTPLSQQSRILAADGTLIATPYDENRVIVPLAKIAPVMRQAQIAIEDSRFYEHAGIDPQAIGRALISNLSGGDTQGASTLTQQYVKITLQENALKNDDREGARAATARSYTRKFQELKYAVTLEKNLTKDQILQGYLNLVYYGDRAYGVEAAARHFFGVSAAELNLPQAATLAGLVQQPGVTDPLNHPARALTRRNVVLDRMHSLSLITDQAWLDAKATKMVTKTKPARNSCPLSPYPYFCEYVTKWLLELPALGDTTEERIKRINRGGLTIQTTLDPKMQSAARQELVARVPIGNDEKIGAGAVVVEPGTGHILAMAQNTRYSRTEAPGTTTVNWGVDAKYGGSNGFAYGSTAKMFAVAEALRSGMPIDSTVPARPADPKRAAGFFPHEFKEKGCKTLDTWWVRNDDNKHNGQISLSEALAHSVNTAFAGLTAKLGACSIRAMATKMGVHRGNGEPIEIAPAAITLGSGTVSPLTLASAYATVASGGTYCKPSPVLSITTSDKTTLALPKSACKRVLEPDVANGVSKILKTVLTGGTGSGNELAGGRPAAGKTGTTGNNNETWFVGYTPQLSTAVWVGTPEDDKKKLRNLTLGGTRYGVIFGSTIATPIWKGIMDRASAGMPIRDFAEPDSKVQYGDFVSIPSIASMTVDDARAALTAAGFKPAVGGAVNSTLPAGLAVGTQPDSRALRGTEVVILTSTGFVPVPSPIPPPAAVPVPPPVAALPNPSMLPQCGRGVPKPCVGRGRPDPKPDRPRAAAQSVSSR